MSDEKKTCEKCGEAQESFELDLGGGLKTYWRCPTCIARKDAEEYEQAMKRAQDRVRRQFGPHHMRLEVELPKRALDVLLGETRGLFIEGSCGSGKTQTLCQIARMIELNRAVKEALDGEPRSSSGFLYQTGISIAPHEQWGDRDPGFGGVLLLDDVDLLNKERFHADLLGLIDTRWRLELPTIITSSVPLHRVSDVYGIRNRIEAMCGEPLVLPSVNHRLKPR